MTRLFIAFTLLYGCFLQATPPVWKTDPVQLKAYDRIPFYFDLEDSFTDVDSSVWTYRATSLPSWIKLETSFGELSGNPTTAHMGKHIMKIEVSDDGGMSWVPARLELDIISRPALTCPYGDPAQSIGSTPEGLYEIFSCRLNNQIGG